MSTKIDWCDETINPIIGCSKTSPGCKNCYAEKMACRLSAMGVSRYDVTISGGTKPLWSGGIAFAPSELDKPYRWKSPRTIFLCSMGDIFHENVPFPTPTMPTNPAGWLAGISYQGVQPVYSVSYPTFDKVGNRTAKNEGSLITYGYDAVYRLLNSTAGEVFTYDDAGNRLSDAARLYTVTAGNVMSAAGTAQYTYDSYGNTLTAGLWSYTWNSVGQLVGASNGATVASYAYDPFGRRISKTVNGASTTYVYDGQDIAASISGGTTTHFVHGTGIDEHLALVQGGLPILSMWTD